MVRKASKCWDHEKAQNAGYMIPLRTAFRGTLYDSYKKEQECIIVKQQLDVEA